MSIYWSSLSDFLAMGQHGVYVWGSFGVTALLMVGEPVWLRRRGIKLRQLLLRRQRAQELEEGQ